jgi:hypothetical protein
MATNLRRKRDDTLRRLCLQNGRSDRNLNLVSSGVQKALFFASPSVLFFFIDKTGRHPLLIYSAFGMGICQFVVGGLIGKHGVIAPSGVGNPPNAKAISQVESAPAHSIIAFCYILIIIYALILVPVTWVYAVEDWSLETRATGMPLAAVSNWFSNWTLGCFVPPALHNITYKLFVIFRVLCSQPRFEPSLRILRRVGRLWRRLSCPLGRMDQGLIERNSVGVGLIQRLRLLLRGRRGEGGV